MNYETLNDIEACVLELGPVRVEKDELTFNVNLSEETVMKDISFVWNCMPEMIAEMKRLVRDNERMTTFLHSIQQTAVDSLRCTSQITIVEDWMQGLPKG